MPRAVPELMSLYPQPVRAQGAPGQTEAQARRRAGRCRRQSAAEKRVVMKFLDQMNFDTRQWKVATAYEKFEQIVVLILTGLMIVVIASAVWHLAIKIFFALVLRSFDPTDPAVFQAVFGMIFTVIIALEFKHSILVMVKREESIVQVRTVVLIAMLAVLRKFIIIDLSSTTANQMFALAAGIVALGAVYWLVRDQDRKAERDSRRRAES
jgi:uncharacterized membrane protein (DUF373 family)